MAIAKDQIFEDFSYIFDDLAQEVELDVDGEWFPIRSVVQTVRSQVIYEDEGQSKHLRFSCYFLISDLGDVQLKENQRIKVNGKEYRIFLIETKTLNVVVEALVGEVYGRPIGL